jgi:hypothetical protein
VRVAASTLLTGNVGNMALHNDRTAVVDEMLRYVPSAIPGVVTLTRTSRSPRDGYSLHYLRYVGDDIRNEGPSASHVESAEVPIAAAWNGYFVTGLILMLWAVALGVLFPLTIHDRAVWLTTVFLATLGIVVLGRSNFTPIEPDPLSVAIVVMRLRLHALVTTHDPSELERLLRNEDGISERLLEMVMTTRNTGSRSWASNAAVPLASKEEPGNYNRRS